MKPRKERRDLMGRRLIEFWGIIKGEHLCRGKLRGGNQEDLRRRRNPGGGDIGEET